MSYIDLVNNHINGTLAGPIKQAATDMISNAIGSLITAGLLIVPHTVDLTHFYAIKGKHRPSRFPKEISAWQWLGKGMPDLTNAPLWVSNALVWGDMELGILCARLDDDNFYQMHAGDWLFCDNQKVRGVCVASAAEIDRYYVSHQQRNVLNKRALITRQKKDNAKAEVATAFKRVESSLTEPRTPISGEKK